MIKQRLAQSPQLENYVMMINEFSNDDPAVIAAALHWPRLEQMDVLIAIAADRSRLAVEIRDRLQSMTTPAHRRSTPPPSKAVEAVKIQGGYLTSGGGWSQRVPTTEIAESIKNMATWGFAPRSIRVMHTLTPSIAAITWTRDSSTTRYETGLSAAELMKKFDELQNDDWTMLDFCVLPETEGKRVADADRRFSGLWAKHPSGKGPEQFLTLNIASDDEDPTVKLDNPDFWSTIRFAVSLSEEGKPKQHSLLQKFPSEPLNSVAWTKIRFGDGDRYPGFAQSDLRVTDTLSLSDRGELWDIFIDAFTQISATGGDTNRIAVAAGYLSALGSHEEALDLLGQIEDSHDQGLSEKERGTARRRAALEELIAKLRLGRIDDVRTGLDDEKLGKKLTKPDRDYVTLRLAIVDKDANAIRIGLDQMKSGVQARTASEIHYVHALGAAAAVEPDGSSESFKRLSDELMRIVETGTKLQLESVVLDVDFDPLRAIPEWHSLLHRLGFAERFARCSIVNEQLETKTLELLPAAEHNVAAQQLIDQGFLPIAVEVTTSGNKSDASEANQRVTSLWQRSVKSPEQIAEDAERIGRYCLALSKLGEQDALRDALHDRWGRSVQSYTTAQAERSIEPDELVRLLRAGEASGDPAPIISALGGFKRDRFKPDDLRYLLTQLKNWSTSAERAELLNVSRWCLGSLGESVEPLPISQAPNKRSNWSTNSLGLQMVEIQVPEVVLVGKVDLDCLWHKVNRKIQVSSTEIRGRDYEQFRTDERVRRWIDSDRVHRNSRTADSDIAQSGMSWKHAVMFCQWLNEREKVPESEWCYLNVWDADKPIAPAPDYVNRMGYRLPTLAEWIWICGAGSKEPWHWGSDGSLAAYYEWTMPHSAGIVHAVGKSRPNVFGLFDISGNVSEIIDSRIRPPYRPNQGFAYVDVSNADPKSLNEKALALGGRYRATASEAVTLKRVSFLPDEVSYSNGFRVVRTKSRD
ncbi:MAG: SUMF1/EgtB/PvdO family nonheme iron enzyme [Pirellulales bacterium]